MTITASAPRPSAAQAARQGLPSPAGTASVAPNSRAASSLPATRSTATIRRAPAMRAPWMALSPTPPAPITTTSCPGRTRAALTAAPTPVTTPQDSRHAASIGMSSGIRATWDAWTVTASAKAPESIAWCTGAPSGVVSGWPGSRGGLAQ